MDPALVGVLAVILMLAAIYVGVHIGVALVLISFGSVTLMRGPEVALRMIGAAATDTIREDLFSVVPLFVLLGMLVSLSGVGRDTFDVAETLLRRLRGGLGIATVKANAVFAAITGVSVASATIFARVAVPEMRRHGYDKRFAVGVVAGSSVLGMLIPPSLLFIVYGVLAEESVGKLFIAGILPGLLLAAMFSVMIYLMARLKPRLVYASDSPPAPPAGPGLGPLALAAKAAPIAALVTIILGGLYSGFFNPTEAAAVGALAGVVVAAMRGSLDRRTMWDVLVSTGHVAVSVLFLILAASLYSRMLSLAGLPQEIARVMTTGGLGPWGFLAVYLVVVLALGCILDSVSILLILMPIVVPIAQAFGFDKIWFGVVTVIAIEVGLLTPPFGLSVYTVKASLDDPDLTVWDVFAGCIPFILCMLACLAIIIAVPAISLVLVR